MPNIVGNHSDVTPFLMLVRPTTAQSPFSLTTYGAKSSNIAASFASPRRDVSGGRNQSMYHPKEIFGCSMFSLQSYWLHLQALTWDQKLTKLYIHLLQCIRGLNSTGFQIYNTV